MQFGIAQRKEIIRLVHNGSTMSLQASSVPVSWNSLAMHVTCGGPRYSKIGGCDVENSVTLTSGQRLKGIYPRPCDLHKCYHVAGSFQETIFCNPILVVGTPSPSVYLNRGRPGNDASSSSHKLLVNKIKGLVLFFFPTDLGQRHQGDPHVDTGRGWDQRVSCISHKSRKQFRKFLDDYWSAMGRSCGSCGSSSQVGSKIW